jgi:hypothetical protein
MNGLIIKSNYGTLQLSHWNSIINSIKFWIETYWQDFNNDTVAHDALENFIKNINNVKLGTILKNAISKRVIGMRLTR